MMISACDVLFKWATDQWVYPAVTLSYTICFAFAGHSSLVDLVLLVLPLGLDYIWACGFTVWWFGYPFDCSRIQWTYYYCEGVSSPALWIQARLPCGCWSCSLPVDAVFCSYLHLCHQVPQFPASVDSIRTGSVSCMIQLLCTKCRTWWGLPWTHYDAAR